MYRMNYGGKRGYVNLDPFRAYSGLTGSLSAATFKGNQENKRLDKWRDRMVDHLGGQDKQESYLNSMADFGTAVHQVLLTIHNNGCLDWDKEAVEAAAYFEASAIKNKIIPNQGVIQSQVFEYCKSSAALLQFVHEQVEEIYGIESMSKDDDLAIATPVDLVCRIKTKKGSAVVSLNIKTSGQITQHHLEQAAMEKYLWNQTYPDFQVEKTGILRPKDWSIKKGLPTYELELLDEQTEHELLNNALNRLKLVKNDPNATYLTFPGQVYMFTGINKMGEPPKIESKTFEQVFKESHQTEVVEIFLDRSTQVSSPLH